MAVFFMIIIVSILALLQVAYYAKRALKKVGYERGFNKTAVFTGEKVELVEVITNDKLVPVPWTRIESRISAALRFKKQENLNVNMDRFHKSVFFLGSYSKITRRHEISCLKRGYYDCSIVSVVAGDLFGLASVNRDLHCGAKLYVYPRASRLNELPSEALKWQGEVTASRWILPDPILVSGVREYKYGDSQKDVHWGATARTGILQVKMRDFTVTPRIMLVFNTQISEALMGEMDPDEVEYLEGGINICAALAAFCVENGLDVGFLSNGAASHDDRSLPYIAPACSAGHLEGIFRQLATLVIRMQLGIHTVLDRHIESGISGMDIVIISKYWSELLEKRALELRGLGNTVTHIPIV